MGRRHGLRTFGVREGCFAMLLLAGLVLLATQLPGPGAAQAKPVAAPQVATTFDARAAEDYWTAERIAEAEPLALPVDRAHGHDSHDTAAAELFGASAAMPVKSTTVKKPRRYPNRVHGKLTGTFRDLGDFSCSATVVSSRSGSLLNTAGHCVYDRSSRQFATNLAFAPGYKGRSLPYGIFPVSNAIVTSQWVRRGALAYDTAMLRADRRPNGDTVQDVVGSRGIGFDQPRGQRLKAYGYPASGARRYDGTRLIRCASRNVRDPNGRREGGPRSRGMLCNMKGGSSGGGWVSQDSFIVSNVSHGHPGFSNRKFYGPYFGAVAKSLYRARVPGWPSIGPVRCRGKVATIIGTSRGEALRGTRGRDVIHALGGDDRIKGKGGRDTVCGGAGGDRLSGGRGRDRIDGGLGRDRCNGGRGKDRARNCERRRR